MTKKLVYKIILGIIFYFVLSTAFKAYKNSTLSESCLTKTFNKNFSDLSTLDINSIHDFDEIFDCQDWDEIFIHDAIYYSRRIGYLTSGILVPSYDINEYHEGVYLVYFLKNSIIVSTPNSLYSSNFIISQNFNDGNNVRINRKKAKFIYQKFEHSDYDFNTLELVKD